MKKLTVLTKSLIFSAFKEITFSSGWCYFFSSWLSFVLPPFLWIFKRCFFIKTIEVYTLFSHFCFHVVVFTLCWCVLYSPIAIMSPTSPCSSIAHLAWYILLPLFRSLSFLFQFSLLSRFSIVLLLPHPLSI